MRLTYRAKALADIRSTALYIAEDSPLAAIRWRDRILDRCGLLAEMPGLGTSRPDILASLRIFPVGRYVILYRETQTALEILRVVHGARQWQTEALT